MNQVIHFEIIGTEGTALEKFYGELFGWPIQSMPELSYGLVDTQAGEGINGGIGTAQDGAPYVTFYVEVSDLEEALRRIESLGGKRLMDPMEIPDVVSFAQFEDPQGNRVGLVKGDGGGETAVSPGDGIAVGWFEVLGTDGAALREFYGKAFDWTFVESGGPMDYATLDVQPGRGIPGGVGTSQGEPVTTVYAGVPDLAAYLARAEELGGTTVLQPMKVSPGTEICAIRDPQGNLFGMYTHKHPHD